MKIAHCKTLVEKAKNCRSAEEFINTQVKPVYHGTIGELILKERKQISVTSDRKIAEEFSHITWYQKDQAGEPFVAELFISSGAKILSKEKIPKALAARTRKITHDFAKTGSLDESLEKIMRAKQKEISVYAKKRGFDGVEMPGDESEILINNPSVLKTRSQLIDLWKKVDQCKSEKDFEGCLKKTGILKCDSK